MTSAAGCPDPSGCPVPDPPHGVHSTDLSLHVLPGTASLCRVVDLRYGYDTFNPGNGCSRFAPITTAAGVAVPTLYLAASEVGALLESVLHNVHHAVRDRMVYVATVRNHGLAYVRPPRNLRLLDLRDGELARLGLPRAGLVSSTAEHYPCTQEWARWLHDQRSEADGLLWHSRQAELRDPTRPEDVAVVFGDRVDQGRGSFPLVGPGVRNLVEGVGRVLLEELAEQLDALVVGTVPG